jgi:hypothetical protein
MATITGTVFLRTRTDPLSVQSGQNYMSVCFFSVMLLFFNGQTELTIAVRRRGACVWSFCRSPPASAKNNSSAKLASPVHSLSLACLGLHALLHACMAKSLFWATPPGGD